jgi:protein-disulfide isomerase
MNAHIARFLALAALVLLSAASPAHAQADTSSARDLAAMRADLERIKTDLQFVRGQLDQLLRAVNQRPTAGRTVAAGPVRVSLMDAPTLGRADAPVTIVEFSDYQCPFCQRFFATTLAAIRKDYIDAGKVRYVFRDYPLDQLHPYARKAAEAAHCAGDQGKYWEMHDALFRNQRALASEHLDEHARSIGLDGPAFQRCLSSGRHAAQVARGLADGAAAGVQGTPGFVIGRTTSKGIMEGMPVRGAQPLETFRQLIEDLLASGKSP